MKLNVRCCCTPTKIFGTLEIPDKEAKIGSFPLYVPKQISFSDAMHCAPPVDIRSSYNVYRIRLRVFGRGELAVYSDDRSLEFWQQIPGFTAGAKLSFIEKMFAMEAAGNNPGLYY